MHIVFVSREYPPSLRGGGIATYLKTMAEGFTARGHEVTVIAANDDTRCRDESVINGVRVIRTQGGDFLIKEAEPNQPKLKKLRFAYRFCPYRKKIVNEIKKLKNIDIVEVAEFGAEGLYLHKLNIPIVYRLHTPNLLDHTSFSIAPLSKSNFPYYLFGKIELDILHKYARYMTSCSTSLKEWTIKYIGVPEQKIKVIYNPLPVSFFNNESTYRYISNEKYVFFAGTICDWKGTEDLFEAMKIVNEGRKDKIKLLMAGKTGAFSDYLKEKGKNYDWFEILGKLSQDKLKAMYQNAAVVCFPSWWENMPMVCLEAMAVGAIVIGSNSGGMSEIIEDGKNGFLLPPQQPQLWAKKINEVLSMTDSERDVIANEAKVRIKSAFSLEKILEETEAYYNEVINKKIVDLI